MTSRSTATATTSAPCPPWQSQKHLKSGDRVWILTDVETRLARYRDYSTPQLLLRVGIYDLTTGRIGFATFGKDTLAAILKAGLPKPPPWSSPLPFGILVHREAHDNDEEDGRFRTRIDVIEIDPALSIIVPLARKRFRQEGHSPSFTPPAMWEALAKRATESRAIETAALSMPGLFSAGDVKRALGNPKAKVSDVLKELVRRKKLIPSGEKRGRKYQVAPPPRTPSADRADWTGDVCSDDDE